MHGPEPAEIAPGEIREIEKAREGELQGNDEADEKARDAPEHACDDSGAHDAVLIGAVRRRSRPFEIVHEQEGADQKRGEENPAMDSHGRFRRPPHDKERQNCTDDAEDGEENAGEVVAAAFGQGFSHRRFPNQAF